MESLKKYLLGIYTKLPKESSPQSTAQRKVNDIRSFIENEQPEVIEHLQDVNFTAIQTIDDVTTAIVNWNEIFNGVRRLVDQCERCLRAATFTHVKVIRELQDVQIAVAGVISRAIAQLAKINNTPMREIGFEQLFG